jgi:hypothetical protein
MKWLVIRVPFQENNDEMTDFIRRMTLLEYQPPRVNGRQVAAIDIQLLEDESTTSADSQ